jgi:putative ABC transport system permease protein
LVVSFAEWRKPGGGSTNSLVVGADPEDGGLAPWNVVEGSVEALSAPDAIAIDRTYLRDLGVKGVGDTAQIETARVKIRVMTSGIRSFTMAPYVFTTLDRARTLLGVPGESTTFFLIATDPRVDVEPVRRELAARLPNTEVLTKAEFRDRSLDQWLFSTGAGVALIGGAILGVLVGTVIVAQTLYASTKDHLIEFATLRALGSSSGYIHKVILAQAGLSAVIGYVPGMVIALTVVAFSERTALPIVMPPGLAAALFLLTLFMCAISAVSAIMKVTRIDPAMVLIR